MKTIISETEQIPCMILSQDAEIIDTNGMSESCLREIADKTLLFNSMNGADRARLSEFCMAPVSPSCDDLFYVKNTVLFELHLRSFKFGFAKKTAHFSGPLTEMYLFKDRKSLLDPNFPFSSRLPYIVAKLDSASRYIKNHLELFKDYSDDETDASIEPLLSQMADNNIFFTDYLRSLYSPQKLNTTSEVVSITDSLITKLKAYPDLIYSKINFQEKKSCHEDDGFSHHAIKVDSGSYIYLLTLLLSVLNTASDSYEIDVEMHRFSDNVEITLSTDTSSIPAVLNNTSDIISLSPYIPGSYFKLSLAFYIAASQDYRLNTFFSPRENKLGFSLGFMPDFPERLDFKYRDPLENFETLSDEAIELIKSCGPLNSSNPL